MRHQCLGAMHQPATPSLRLPCLCWLLNISKGSKYPLEGNASETKTNTNGFCPHRSNNSLVEDAVWSRPCVASSILGCTPMILDLLGVGIQPEWLRCHQFCLYGRDEDITELLSASKNCMQGTAVTQALRAYLELQHQPFGTSPFMTNVSDRAPIRTQDNDFVCLVSDRRGMQNF